MAFRYSPKIITNGLILYYDGANPQSYISGDTVCNDLSITQSIGTLENGVTYDTDKNGFWTFDGVDDYINLPNMELDYPFNISFWALQTLTDPYGPHVVFSNPTVQNKSIAIGLLMDGNVGIRVFEYDGGFRQVYLPTTSVSKGVWYCVSGNFTTTSFDLYVDGVYITQLNLINPTKPWTDTDTSYNLNKLDRAVSPDHWYPGYVSNIAIYNRPLTATEILQNYNTMKSRFK